MSEASTVQVESVDSIIKRGIEECRNLGIRFGNWLSMEFGTDEIEMYNKFAIYFSLPFLSSIQDRVSEDLLKEIPVEMFAEGRCFPLYEKDSTIGIVVSDPLDFDIVLDIERATGLNVEVHMTSIAEIDKMWRTLFMGDSLFTQAAETITSEYEKQYDLNASAEALSSVEILRRTESEPVVRMVNLIIEEAIEKGASDIHIEPLKDSAVVRYRVDGMLDQYIKLGKAIWTPVTSRMKIMASLDIAERRIPQDGRIVYSRRGNEYELRVSTLPTQYGEKIVIRILRHDNNLLNLDYLGMEAQEREIVKTIIEKPKGMIIVTGPTGSGKSTALFSFLNQIRHKPINITTIENPIEYRLDGLNQVEINEKAGLDFTATLRSILRQDPDVILIGEIRDGETARIAMQAAQTGHLVFSTLHTNDAIAAITRLKDLGVKPFLISSSLLAVIALRLVRVLCPFCKEKVAVSESIKSQWRAAAPRAPIPEMCYKAIGCSQCGSTGYRGRMGIFEMITLTEDVREMITEDISETKLRQNVRTLGMRSLIESGIAKVEQGILSIDELLRVIEMDDN